MQQFGQQRQEEQRRQEAEAYKQEAKQAMAQAFQSGDPMAIRQAVIQYPEIAETATQMFGFTNEQTERVARETYRRALSTDDDEQAAAILEGGIETVRQLGGNPRMMAGDLQAFRSNPQAGRRSMRGGFAALASDQEFRAVFPEAGGTADPAAVRAFEARARAAGFKPGSEEYQRAAQIELGLVPRAGISAEERIATQREVGEAVAEQAGREAGATEQAKQDVRSQSPEAIRQRREDAKASRMNIASTEDVVRQADDILNNEDFIDAITGARGRLPAVPGTAGFDAEVALDRLKNSLTLGNLDKMSGVLSESDIKILASEAGGLEPGMSREAMLSRLRQIREVFQSKTNDERKKLADMMSQEQGQPKQDTTEVNWSDL